ncbi:MAG: exonuclease domain-containing protein [Halarcobacter ebronensis]
MCLDCETTGLKPRKDEILSIGAVLIKDNKII